MGLVNFTSLRRHRLTGFTGLCCGSLPARTAVGIILQLFRGHSHHCDRRGARRAFRALSAGRRAQRQPPLLQGHSRQVRPASFSSACWPYGFRTGRRQRFQFLRSTPRSLDPPGVGAPSWGVWSYMSVGLVGWRLKPSGTGGPYCSPRFQACWPSRRCSGVVRRQRGVADAELFPPWASRSRYSRS